MLQTRVSGPRQGPTFLLVSLLLSLLLTIGAPTLGIRGARPTAVAQAAAPPPLTAQSAVLINIDTGEVLWGLN
jgi:D-alanyl-D-alanine carboxypeptidase